MVVTAAIVPGAYLAAFDFARIESGDEILLALGVRPTGDPGDGEMAPFASGAFDRKQGWPQINRVLYKLS